LRFEIWKNPLVSSISWAKKSPTDKEIPKNKRQIPNKFQIPKRQIPNLSAHWRDKTQIENYKNQKLGCNQPSFCLEFED
jgi:hypothetical protein